MQIEPHSQSTGSFVRLGVGQDLQLGLAGESDLPYVVELLRKNKESLGFLPRMAIAERITKGTIIIGRLNGDPFGYILYDMRGKDVNILQACIQYDARRKLYGAALLQFGMLRWKPDFVRLKCAADLESNLFWQSMGFICVGVLDGGKRRGRKINVWHRYECPQLITVTVTPAFQLRVDCADEESDFMVKAPDGFLDYGSLGKLAWKTHK